MKKTLKSPWNLWQSYFVAQAHAVASIETTAKKFHRRL